MRKSIESSRLCRRLGRELFGVLGERAVQQTPTLRCLIPPHRCSRGSRGEHRIPRTAQYKPATPGVAAIRSRSVGADITAACVLIVRPHRREAVQRVCHHLHRRPCRRLRRKQDSAQVGRPRPRRRTVHRHGTPPRGRPERASAQAAVDPREVETHRQPRTRHQPFDEGRGTHEIGPGFATACGYLLAPC